MKSSETTNRFIILLLSALGLAGQTAIYAYYWFQFFYGSVVSGTESWEWRLWQKGHMVVIAIYVILLFFFSNMYSGMKYGELKNVEVIFSQLLSTFFVNVITYCQISVMARRPYHMKIYFSMMFLQAIFVIIWTNVCSRVHRVIYPPRKLLLVYGDRPVQGMLDKLTNRPDRFTVTKYIHVREGLEVLSKEVQNDYDAVLLWDIQEMERNKILKICYAHDIYTFIMPKIPDVLMKGAEELHLFDSPLFLLRDYRLTLEQRVVKRFIDLFCAILLAILTTPFMILTALAVKLYDGGPVLYKQIRCTIHGKKFQIMKFRSMRVDAEKDGVARLASKGDARITPVGRVIRKCRLDELPQLFNIIKGEMSFIGPRPERPEIIEEYLEVMPEFAYRMKVKAGLAGYAQVYGKYNTTPYDKLKLDLSYIENYSIRLDLKLMLLTLKVILWPDSTEGVEKDQVTALKKEIQKSREEES